MSWRDAFTILLPPRNPTPETLEAWRLVIFASILVLAIALATHILVSMGRISPDHGFVTVAAMDERNNVVQEQFQAVVDRLDVQEEKFDRAEIRQVESEIRNLRAEQCEAMRDENSDAVRATSRVLDEHRAEYHFLTLREYPLPTCIETGVRIE